MTARVDGAVRELAENGADALWVEPSTNFTYLFGFDLLSLERLCGVVVTATGELRALVPLMHAEEFEGVRGIELFTWTDGDGPGDAAASCLKGIKTLLVSHALPAWALLALKEASGAEIELDEVILPGLRVRKDSDEVDQLRRAGAVTDEVIEWISSQIPDCASEADLALRIKAHYLELGHDDMLALVASGANAAMPHHLGSDQPIEGGSPLLIDIGARIGTYWSDTTRVFFPGDNNDVGAAYEAVVNAYDAAFSSVGPGVPCEQIDRAARSVIEDAGYGEYFIHRTGHGLGLEVHEPPFLRGGNPMPLEVGNVFTIEPGVYLPNRFGLRFENSVYLGPDGPEELNKTPRVHTLP